MAQEKQAHQFREVERATGSLRGLRQYNIATLHNYYPQGVANIDFMQPSLVVDADKPVPVTIEPGFMSLSAPANEWVRSLKVFGAAQEEAAASMWPSRESARFPQRVPAPSPQMVLPPPPPQSQR